MSWPELFKRGDPLKDAVVKAALPHYVDSINGDSLSRREREILEEIMRKSAPDTIHLWGENACFPFSQGVLRHFQSHPGEIPRGVNLLAVSTNFHSWIEAQTDSSLRINNVPRGDLIFDPTGLSESGRPHDPHIIHIGRLVSAPSHLANCYSESTSFTVQTTDGQTFSS